jgi:hypothetical protein
MVYSALFGVGKILFHSYAMGIALVLIAIASAWRMRHELTSGHGSEAAMRAAGKI